METFMGYHRPDGTVGIRNHVLAMASVACANGVLHRVKQLLPDVTIITHGHGCGRAPQDSQVHFRALANLGKNPNVAAVLVIGLGCEFLRSAALRDAIGASGKPVASLDIQAEGGTDGTVDKAVTILQGMLEAAHAIEKKPFALDKITLGLQCGGSDALSGITANPATGLASDWLVQNGGTVLLTESTEMIGTTQVLRRRACDVDCADRIEKLISDADALAHQILGPYANAVISPGNMDGGMTTIQEKSLGCITKAGASPIQAVIGYGEIPQKPGLIVMDGPGYDMESITGVAAGGAQVIVFTTGRGTPVGFPIVPVIKVASNTALFGSMACDMDVNAGTVAQGERLSVAGEAIIEKIREVLRGESTKSERNAPDPNVCLFTVTPAF